MTEVEKLMAMIATQKHEAYMRGRDEALFRIREAVSVDMSGSYAPTIAANTTAAALTAVEVIPVKRGRGRPRKNP